MLSVTNITYDLTNALKGMSDGKAQKEQDKKQGESKENA